MATHRGNVRVPTGSSFCRSTARTIGASPIASSALTYTSISTVAHLVQRDREEQRDAYHHDGPGDNAEGGAIAGGHARR